MPGFHIQSRPKFRKRFSILLVQHQKRSNHRIRFLLVRENITSGISESSGEANSWWLKNLNEKGKVSQRFHNILLKITGKNPPNLRWWFLNCGGSQIHDQESQIIIGTPVLRNLANRQAWFIQSRCQEVQIGPSSQWVSCVASNNIDLPMRSSLIPNQSISNILSVRIKDIRRRNRLLTHVKSSKREINSNKNTKEVCKQQSNLLATSNVPIHRGNKVRFRFIEHRVEINLHICVNKLDSSKLLSNFQIISHRTRSSCAPHIREEVHRRPFSFSVNGKNGSTWVGSHRQEKNTWQEKKLHCWR